MGQTFFTVPTEIGQRKILQHANNGTELNVIKLAVGDANGEYYKPTPDMTTLKNQVWEGLVTDIEIVNAGAGKVVYKTMLNANEGAFSIREMAIFDEDGDMIAIANTPLTEQTDPISGALTGTNLSLTLVTNHLEAISLIVDTSVVGVTKADLEAHNTAPESHPLILAELSKKADKGSPNVYEPIFSSGITAYKSNWYYRNDFKEVKVQIGCKIAKEVIPQGKVITTMPEGFRPEKTFEVLASISFLDGTGKNGNCIFNTNGTLVLSNITPLADEALCFINVTYLVK